MNTTMLFAEIIVIGLQSSIWILLLVLSVFGSNWITAISTSLKDWQTFLIIIFVPIIYILGIITDRLSDVLTDPWNEKIKKQIIGKTKYPSTVMRFALGQSNPILNQQLEYTRTRMRIMRASAVNFTLTAIFGLIYVSSRLTTISNEERIKYILFILIAGILLDISSLHVWRSLLKDHLGLVKSNYEYYINQESNHKKEKSKTLMFNEQTGALLIPLTFQQTGFSSVQKEYQGKIFSPKQELHITIIGTNLGRELKNAFLGNPYLHDRFLQCIIDTDWSYELQNDLYHIAKEKTIAQTNGKNEIIRAESIIQIVKVPNINEFYNKLAEILKIELEHPFMHITLFTYGDSKGISIQNQTEFNKHCVSKISLTDLGFVQQVVNH